MTDLRTLKAGSGTVATDIFNAVIDAILGGLRFTASNVDSGAATDGQVLTADGAGGASWEAGGGSQPVTGVRIAFDTPNLYTQAFAITGVNVGAQTFTIAGDHRTLFPAANYFAVVGSSANDGTYLVASVDLVDGDTVVTVEQTLPAYDVGYIIVPFGDATVDGNLVNVGTAGVAIYTPDPGDFMFVYPLISVTTPFDNGALCDFGSMPWGGIGSWAGSQDLTAGADQFAGWHYTEPGFPLSTGAGSNVLRFSDTTPFKAMVYGNGSGFAPPNPLPTQGEAFIALMIVKGANV